MARSVHASAISAGVLTLFLTVGMASAQKPLPPLPKPETEPPVPTILQNYKPVTADRLTKPDDGD